MDAIMYIVKMGCQWRMLPRDSPPYNVVDTLGLPMGVVVHEANIHDSVGAHSVIDAMQGRFPRLK